MKKILGISLVAMMAVTAANADIVSKAYITPADGTYVKANKSGAENFTALDTQLATVSGTAGTAIQSVEVNGAALTPEGGAVNVTVAEGSTNGTVAVNGADIAVHGLGSAAYKGLASSGVADAETGLVTGDEVHDYVAGEIGNLGTHTVGNETVAYTDVKDYVDDKVAAAGTTAGNTYVAKAQGNTAAEQNKALITDNSGNVTLGTITSGMITDATIVNADIASDAAIGMGKIAFPALENSAAGAYVLTGVSDGNNGITYHWELISRP